MACIYVYTTTSGKVKKYKTLEDLINDNHESLWSEYVDYAQTNLGLGKNYDWYSKESLKRFKNYVDNILNVNEKADKVNKDEETLDDEQELEKQKAIKAELFERIENALANDEIDNEFLKNSLNVHLQRIYDAMGSKDPSTYTAEMMTQLNHLLSQWVNDVENKIEQYINKGEAQPAKDLKAAYNKFVTETDFENSINFVNESEEMKVKLEQQADRADTAKGKSELTKSVSSDANNSIFEESHKSGVIDADEVLSEEEQQKLEAIKSLKEGDVLTAEFENRDSVTDPYTDKVVLKKNGVVVGTLNTASVDSKTKDSTSGIRNKLKTRKSVNVTITKLKNTSDNIWATRQLTLNTRGANNNLLSKVVTKIKGVLKGESIGGYRIARVPKNTKYKNELYNIVTGESVHFRTTGRTDKFYVEVPTVGNKTVWFPVNVSTVSETVGVNKEFGERLITETAFRMMEFIEQIRAYNALKYEMEQAKAKGYPDKSEDTYTKELKALELEVNTKEGALSQLIATGKFDRENGVPKSYFNYERNVKRITNAFISSNSLIMSNGSQASLDIRMGKTGDKIIVTLAGQTHILMGLNDPNALELFTNIAKASTRNVEMETDTQISTSKKFKLSLRDKEGNSKTFTFNSYADYIEQTGALLSDMGAITKNGEPISNLNLTSSNIYDIEVEDISTGKKKSTSKVDAAMEHPMSVEDFISKFIPDLEITENLRLLIEAFAKTGYIIIDTQFTPNDIKDVNSVEYNRKLRALNAKLEKLENAKTPNSLKIAEAKKEIEEFKDSFDQMTRNVILQVNHGKKIIMTTSAIMTMLDVANRLVENGQENEASELYDRLQGHIIHELMHPLLNTSLSSLRGLLKQSAYKEHLSNYVSEIVDVVKQIESQIDTVLKGNNSKWDDEERAIFMRWFDNVMKPAIETAKAIAAQGRIPQKLEELFTDAFTNKTIASVLNSMNYDPGTGKAATGETKTMFQKLIDMLLKLLGMSLNKNSILAKAKDIVGDYLDSRTMWDVLDEKGDPTVGNVREESGTQTDKTGKQSKDNKGTPQREERNITIAAQQLRDIISALENLDVDIDNLNPSDLQNEHAAKLFENLSKLLDLNSKLRDAYSEAFNSTLSEVEQRAVVTALQFMLGSLQLGTFEQLLSHYEAGNKSFKAALMHPTNNLGALNYLNNYPEEIDELEEEDIQRVKDFIIKVQNELNDDILNTEDYSGETGTIKNTYIKNEAKRILENLGGLDNGQITPKGENIVKQFNTDLESVGLPHIFSLEGTTLNIDEHMASVVDDIINNSRYRDIAQLVLYRSNSNGVTILNDTFKISRLKQSSMLLFDNIDGNINVQVLGYMIDTAVNEAIIDVATEDNDQIDADAFELSRISKEIVDYFGGRENVIKMLQSPIETVTDLDGRAVALIAALPVLKARKTERIVGEKENERKVYIPTAKFNNTGFSEMVLQDIANSLVYFFGISRRDYVKLLEKLYDDEALNSEELAIRNELINSTNVILKYYKAQVKSGHLSKELTDKFQTYITNLETIVNDLKHDDSEVWNRFISYISKELDIVEESTVAIDKMIDDAIQGKGTLFGKARVRSKQTISSNVKHLLWGNIIIADMELNLEHAKAITNNKSDMSVLTNLIKSGAVEVSKYTGLPVTMSAAQTKDILIAAGRGAVNKSDFINRLNEVAAMYPTLYTIVNEATKEGNESLLRKLYSAIKLQAPYYVVGEIGKNYKNNQREVVFNTRNPEINPAMAIASSINNKVTSIMKYKTSKDLKALSVKLTTLLNRVKDGIDNNKPVVPHIVSILHNITNDSYKFVIYKAIEKVIDSNPNFAKDFITLINKYNTDIIKTADRKQRIEEDFKKGIKDTLDVQEAVHYYDGIKVFKPFNDIAYYYALDSFYTTVDLSTAYSYQLPSHLTELLDKFNNEEALLELGNEWYQDPGVKYNRMFNTMFKVVDGKVEIRNPDAVGTYTYANFGGIVNKDVNNRLEYESIVGNDLVVAKMLMYLSDYMLMNSSSDASRMYGVFIPGNKTVLNNNELKMLFDLVNNIKDVSAEDLNEIEAFQQISNILYGELNEMITARNAFFDVDTSDGTLTVKGNVNKIELLDKVHKVKGELLKDGVAVGRVFTFANLKVKRGNKRITFDQFLKERGINLIFNGVPLFKSERLTSQVANSFEDILNNSENVEAVMAIQDFVKEYLVSAIRDRLTAIEPIADKMRDIAKASTTEVNRYNVKDYDKLVNSNAKDIDLWSYSFIIDEILSNFDWNKIFQGDSIEFGDAIKQSKRLSQDIRPGVSILSDEVLRTLTIADASPVSNLLDKIEKRIPEMAKFYKGTEGVKDEAATDGMTFMTRKGFERFIKEQGLEDKYEGFLKALDSNNYSSDDFKYGVQSLKTFYFDRPLRDYGNGYKRLTSEQIKHSIFVLTEDFAYSQDQKDLIKFMDEFHIDAVDFNSTEKVGTTSVYELMDPKTKRLKDINDIDKLDLVHHVHTRRIDKYRIQLELPQHSADYEGKIATQMKRIFESLDFNNKIYDIDGTKYDGGEIFKMYQELFSLNIENEAYELFKEFGVSFINDRPYINPATGTYEINKNDIYKFIHDFVNRYYNDANLNEGMEIDETGQSKLPIWFTTIAPKLQQRIVARIREKILEQKHVGAHAAVVANAFVGGSFTTLDKVNKDKIDFRADYLEEVDRNRDGDMTLQIKEKTVKNSDGSTKKMLIAEAIISTPTGKFLDQGKQLSINELYELDPKMFQMLAHRIPLEGEQSTVMIDVVGVLNNKASHIILPDDVAVKSGADFDIDTEYLLAYNLEYYKGKLRTVPYYDKLTAENEDYLYSNYVNDHMTQLMRANIIKIKNDYRKSTYAKIHDERNLNNSEFQRKIRELFENKKTSEAFYNLPKNIRNRFKELESIFRMRGMKGFFKFKTYAEIVDKLYILMAMSASDDVIQHIEKNKEIDKLSDDLTIVEFYKDIFEMLKDANEIKRERILSTLSELNTEYQEDLKYYTDNFDSAVADHQSNMKAIREGNWEAYKSNLSEAVEAITADVITREEFRKLPIERINSPMARKNRLLDIISSIISSDSHFNNVMKVNEFDDSFEVAKEVNKLLGNNMDNLDFNNANDRDTLNNLISSSKHLKGISIAFDRAMSIMRPIKGRFANKSFSVPILKSEVHERGLTLDKLETKYGTGNVSTQGDYYVIAIDFLGNNHIGDGTTIFGTNIFKFINQATAHILDSAANPTSKNLNSYTIGVYKLLSISGITHNVALGNNETATENAYYYADLFINHPGAIDVSNEYLDRSGSLAYYNKSLDTKAIVKDLKDVYVRALYKLAVTSDKSNAIDTIENVITKGDKTLEDFYFSKLNSKAQTSLLRKLETAINKIDGTSDIRLTSGVPTIESIKDAMAVNKTAPESARSIANKFAFLDHWSSLRDASNDITQLTNILKTDNMELTDSSIMALDYNIGDAAYNYEMLSEILYNLPNRDLKYPSVIEEVNKFKQLTLKEKYNKVHYEYANSGIDINKLYKFKVGKENLLEEVLPAAFAMNKPGVYSSLNSFYKHAVVLAKSISDTMFAYNFPMGKEIISSLTKGVAVNDRNINTAINWLNGWLATSSSVANMTAGEKTRLLMHTIPNNVSYSFKAYGNTFKVFKNVIVSKLNNEAYDKKNVKLSDESVVTTELDEAGIKDMPLVAKLALVQSLGTISTGYTFVQGMSSPVDRTKVLNEGSNSRPITPYMKLKYPNDVTEKDAQEQIITMYYDEASPIFKSLVEDLYKYAFLQDGLVYGNKISKFLPFRFLTQRGFMGDNHSFGQLLHIEASKLNNIEEVLVTGMGEIRRMFHQANWNNFAFVPTFNERDNSEFKDVVGFNRDLGDLRVGAMFIARKEYIDEDSKLAGKTYIRSTVTNKLYERLDPNHTAALKQSPYYIYREISRLDAFEYRDSYNESYTVKDEAALEDAVFKAANGNIVIPMEDGVYTTMTKVNPDLINTRNVEAGEAIPFVNLKEGRKIDSVTEDPYRMRYSLNTAANKKSLEIETARNADLSIVIDFGINDIETANLEKAVRTVNPNNTFKIDPSDKTKFRESLINAIKLTNQDNKLINLSLHGLNVSRLVDEKFDNVIDMIVNIASTIEDLPISSINNRSEGYNPVINLLMANNAGFAGPISSQLTNNYVNKGEYAEAANTVTSHILFSKGFMTYTDQYTEEVNELEEYGEIENLNSMNLNGDDIDMLASKLEVVQDIMSKSTNGNPATFIRQAAENMKVGEIKTVTEIVNENVTFPETFESEVNRMHGEELHEITTELLKLLFKDEPIELVKEKATKYRTVLVNNDTLDASVTADDLLEFVLELYAIINTNRQIDNPDGKNEMFIESTLASFNPDYVNGNKKGLIVTGRADLFDMNNKGGTLYDLKFSQSTTETKAYYEPYDEATPSKFYQHTLQLALEARLLERPAALRHPTLGNILAPRMSPKFGYILPVRMKLSTYEPGKRSKVVGLEVESAIDVMRGSQYQSAYEHAAHKNRISRTNEEIRIYKEAEDILKLRTTVDNKLKAKSTILELTASLISLSKKYSNSGYDDLIEAANVAIAKMDDKIDAESMDMVLATVASRLKAFTQFAAVALDQINTKLEKYNHEMLNMKQVVSVDGNKREFVKAMNLANWIIKIIQNGQNFATFSTDNIENEYLRDLLKDYNNIVNEYNNLTEPNNKLEDIYLALVKEYMAEMIANYSTNPNIEPFIVRDENGRINMDRASRLFKFEDISMAQLWLDSRFDHGIPFDDAIGANDRIDTGLVHRQKRTELIKFERLL